MATSAGSACRERGAYYVMNKPFDVHAVEGVIRNAHRDTRLR